MPRIRYLKPEFFSDEDLAELKFETRLTYAGLWCFADKAGRLEYRPKFLKAMIFPYDTVDMDKQLDILCQGKYGNGMPFIQRYKIDGKHFIQILSWDKHQRPHHTETESKIPPAPPYYKENGDGKAEQPKLELSNGEATVKRRLKDINDNNWLEGLQKKECYSHLSIKDELQKCLTWFEAKGITVSRQRFLNWINNPKYQSKPLSKPSPKKEIPNPKINPKDFILDPEGQKRIQEIISSISKGKGVEI